MSGTSGGAGDGEEDDAPTPLAFRDSGQGWHLRAHRLVVVRALGVAAALASLLGASLASERGLAGLSVHLVVLAAALVLQALPRRAVGHRGARAVTAPEGDGLLLAARPASATSVLASGLLAALVWLLPLVLAPVVDPAPGRGTPSLAAVVLTVVVCALGGALLALAAARGVRSMLATQDGLLLLPDGVVLRTLSRVVRLEWEEVRAVRPRWTRARGRSDVLHTPEDLVQNWLVLEVEDPARVSSPHAVLSRQPHPCVDVRALAVSPAIVLALCRHYLSHPAHREELAGDDAVRRAAALDATPPTGRVVA